jgi:hypothetical protein
MKYTRLGGGWPILCGSHPEGLSSLRWRWEDPAAPALLVAPHENPQGPLKTAEHANNAQCLTTLRV